MAVVSLSVLRGGKGSSEIRKVKNKQKALSATLELAESTHNAGNSSDFPVYTVPLGFLTHPCKMLATSAKDWGKVAGPVGVKKIAVKFYFAFSQLVMDSPGSPHARKTKTIWWGLHSTLAALGVERAALCSWVVSLQGAGSAPEGAGVQVAQGCALCIQ